MTFLNFYRITDLAKGGTDDNEIASKDERKSWKKWRLPQHLSHPSDSKDSPAPPKWSSTYVILFVK